MIVKNKSTLITILLLISGLASTGQHDSLFVTRLEFITDQLENLAAQTEAEVDFSDLAEGYLYYSDHPINLNGKEIQKLAELYLINEIQLNNLRSYLVRFGPILSIYELKNIPGFDEETFQRILPFVTIAEAEKKSKISPKQLLNHSRHQLILRYNQFLEPTAGQKLPVDAAVSKPGQTCLGTPQAYYMRYAFQFRDKVRLGFTADKDAGELILKQTLTDTLHSLIGKKVSNIFDFFSGYAEVSNVGPLKTLILGDYHLEFGQGLTLWSGLAFGKSATGIQGKKLGRGVRPNTSANENRYLRGAAFTFEWKKFTFSGHYSQNKVDAKTSPVVNRQQESIINLYETGKHRTVNELFTKDAVTIRSFGGHVESEIRNMKLGATVNKTMLSGILIKGKEPYKHFNPEGNGLLNFGLDFSLFFNRINFFGEISGSTPGGLAGITGMNAFLTDLFAMSVLYRHYQPDYYNLLNNPFGSSSAGSNEKGLYFGFRLLLSKNLNLTGYLDFFTFPWLRYRTDAPSHGRDYQFQLNYSLTPKAYLYLRYRYRYKEENTTPQDAYTDLLVPVTRNELRFFIRSEPIRAIVLNSRFDFVRFTKPGKSPQYGFMAYQDVLYRSRTFPLEVTFRYSFFSTDGHESRIYAYEHNVRFAFSVPSYSGFGQRTYLMLRLRAIRKLDIWLRYARTWFSDRNFIGSGIDEIAGNTKSEIKIQLLFKL